ncbi:MAG: FecR domain-containing protein [Ectothiorhodospiraceae bacterium]|jgi:hypothetical protein|nr:FecR domain-containing protein [Ectothiorhodospiraceae bacterium]
MTRRRHRPRTFLHALGLLFLAVSCMAAVCTQASAHEIHYRLQPGDTLIGLGKRVLVDPRDWVVLQRLNRIKDPYRMPTGSILRIPVELVRPEARTAEVVAVVGEARVNGVAATAGETIAAGSRLETGADGHIVLRLPDGSRLALPAHSQMRIDALRSVRGLDGLDVELGLDHGRVESDVPPERGPAARYRVDTPTAVIGVRGTEFRVGADPEAGTSRAEVTRGRVEVQGGEARHGAPVRKVAAGYGLVVGRDAMLSMPLRLLPAPPTDGLPTLFEEPLLRVPLPDMDDAVAWRVQVFTGEPDAPALFDERVTETTARIARLTDGDYVLRLRAIDRHGLEGLDAQHAFRLKARPEPPFLAAPIDDGKVIAGDVAFRWAQAPEAARYRFQLGNGQDFDAALVVDELIEGSSFGIALAPGRYRWRMASLRADGDVGPWSTAATFEVRPLPTTPQPPAVGEDALDFRWSGEPGQRFEYQFADDESFAEPLAQAVVNEPQASLPLPVPGSYWMRVRTIDPDGFVSPWSGAQKVVVPAGYPWWMLPLLLLAL